ncbi:MAG: proton-conducting transporter membrane subunit [Campylobacterota bacterium]|nr:proton-conducting transporter membrane subunit [Campylobacterota bacterium]
MQQYILASIVAPLIFSLILPFNSVRIRNISTYIFTAFLAFISVKVFYTSELISINLSHAIHSAFIVFDFILLGYFIYQGFKHKNRWVIILAIVQTILFIIFLLIPSSSSSYDIVVDKISSVMLLVVNIVGGIIIIYSLKYIQSEEFKDCKKNLFVAILFFFIGVMNLIVTTNNIEIFFLAFELTTLCSYLLIRYRGDEIAVNNALRALWMNQIGGVAILISLIASVYYYETYYFDTLIANADHLFLIPLSFLIISAFVKGASIPFSKWLLGAMVAPTPVSAILHSATMVKIAPYLILKIAPAFSPVLSLLTVLFGSFIFMAASIMALNKDFFKEILGLSTIALLGLMMAVAAIGTQQAVNIALILIVFHAISKALLFLQAGILEKQYHLKYLKDIDHLLSRSKLTVFFIIIGFASLTLPPFGAFIGKFATIEMFTSKLDENIVFIFPLLFILMGSVFLTLLYFKVVTKLLTQDNTVETSIEEKIPLTYIFTSSALTILLVFGIYEAYIYGFMGNLEIGIAAFVFVLTFVLLYFSKYKKAHRVKEYNCGEKDTVELGAFYFDMDEKYQKLITAIAILLISLIIIGGI